MNSTHFDQAEFVTAYDILCASFPTGLDRAGVYPTLCRVPPGGTTRPHRHFETEIFVIISGEGIMRIGSVNNLVRTGSLIRIPSFADHTLENTGRDELRFVSVYSEDFETPALPASAIVTTPPPTPNGPLHIGHISGPYLAADILTRYLRSRGVAVRSHWGTDDQQNYVAEKARSLGQTTEAFRKNQRARILAGANRLGIQIDEYIEPAHDADYQNQVRDFARRAFEAGHFEVRQEEFPYCIECDLYLFDATIEGICPACGHSSHGGCEDCGLVIPPTALENPRCGRCGACAGSKRASAAYFRLDRSLPLIRDDLAASQFSRAIRNLSERVLASEATEILVAHPSNGEDGIPIPGTAMVLHVWAEMAANYEQFAHSGTWIHTFGFDNAFYYLFFIPALHRALNPAANYPSVTISNAFLLLENQKFSTSRNHAIWADEFSGDSDALRFYLALNRPSEVQTNFSIEAFDDFAKTFLDLRSRLGGMLPKSPDSLRKTSRTALVRANRFTRDMEAHYSPQSFDPRQAAHRLLAYADSILNSSEDPALLAVEIDAWKTALAPIVPNREKLHWITDWSRIYDLT